MTRVMLSMAVLGAFAAQAQVKVLGFTAAHVLVYQSGGKGALVKLEETRAPTMVELSSAEWKKASKGLSAVPSTESGGDSMTAMSMTLSSGKTAGTTDGVMTWTLAPKKRPTGDEPPGHALFSVVDKTGQTSNVLALDVPLRALTGKLTEYLDENGGYFAVVAEPTSGPAEVFVGRTDRSGATVEVLTTANMESSAQAVANQLWKAGKSIVRVGRAVKAREQTQVYADKNSMEEGQAIADSISGGASLSPLSWKSDCQVVVGIGESAFQ